ncbi:hypothetical protein C0992_007667 [Termitomyces sp. T32_za158]|nr:hypothetical protein C0992_007667 [Termitomyces sp. T32_za158]
MADSSEQPPGFLEPPGGSTPHETLSALKYQPLPKRDDRLTCDMSESFGMPSRLSISWMKAILNPGSKPGDKSSASALLLPAMNVPSLIYLTLPEDTTFTSRALGKPIQYADTTQGSALAHSSPFKTVQPKHGAKLGPELSSDQTTQYQGVSPATVTGHGKLDKGKVPSAPSVVDERVDSGKEPPTTPAESVDYDAVLRQCKPNIAEAIDMLNAPQQANKSQQDFERWQNAAWRQANMSGMPHWALSEVETATSYHAGDDEAEEPPEMRTPCRRITIKEEECKESIPNEPVTPWRVVRRVHLMDNWNEHVNYQRICNQDLREQGELLIDDQGIVFEGCEGVTPIDDMRQQFVARTGNKDHESD